MRARGVLAEGDAGADGPGAAGSQRRQGVVAVPPSGHVRARGVFQGRSLPAVAPGQGAGRFGVVADQVLEDSDADLLDARGLDDLKLKVFVCFFWKKGEKKNVFLLPFLPLSTQRTATNQTRTFSDVVASVMKNLFSFSAAETFALRMLSPKLRKAATVSSSSPKRSPKRTVTTVANESEVLSMTTSGVGTAGGHAEEGASVAGVAL